MLLKIDYVKFSEDDLGLVEKNPTEVFVNFYGFEHANQEDLRKITRIVDEFSVADVIFMNMTGNLQDELKFILKRYGNIGVFDK